MPKKKQFILEVLNAQTAHRVDTEIVRSVCQRILDDHSVKTGRLEIVFVDSETMHRTNKEFLQHDYPTDVISFPLEDRLDEGHLEGEILVCPSVAAERSAEFGTTPERETLLYAVHGTLHLVGYDDKTPADRKEMRKREKQYSEALSRLY
ncbi:MAG: rRNA maturation RNase YbeY [Planctomycetaceae bacterium]|jgi:probable rRNA maturation factor|nr:rRNA maturation RNase YbeY [Planctomycetaceae bacterium]